MNTKKNTLLMSAYHELVESEWDYEYNNANNINVDIVTYGSGVKAGWHCNACNGKYVMRVKDKTGGQKCPYCTGRKALKGFNDLQTLYPDLIKNEWDYANNNAHGIYPYELTKGSGLKTWWHCDTCDGKYEMKTYMKTSGNGCPFCSGKQVLAGFNDLESCYPNLIEEWNYADNNANGIYPDELTKGSHRKASWKCSKCSYVYIMSIIQRTNGHGCPCCASRKIIPGFNDLKTLCPDLMWDWNWNANDNVGIYPNKLAKSSSVKAYWKCHVCHGDFMMRIANRTSGKQGCPYCAGNRVLKGYNDLQSCYMELIDSEWDWAENDRQGLKPDKVVKYSNLKANWTCSKCSHKWKTRISDRTLKESGCPKCSHRISKQENEVAEYMNNYICSHYESISYSMLRSIKFKRMYEMLGIDTENVLSDGLQAHLMKELDIYIPELKLVVEYDGDYWHDDNVMLTQRGLTNSESHEIKKQLCKQAGIELYFITEHDWVSKNYEVKNNLANIIDKHIE